MTLSLQLHQEASEISKRIVELTCFIGNSTELYILEDLDKELLEKQLDIMKAYKAILMKRMLRLSK